MNKYLHFLCVLSLGFSISLVSVPALAVGAGNVFSVQESNVPGAFLHNFKSDSLDFSYQACSIHDTTNSRFREQGYFWISSYQGRSTVLDSQINYYIANGYRIYGVYTYSMSQHGGSQLTPTGKRLNYVVPNSGSISLYLDVSSDTTLSFGQSCRVSSKRTADDFRLGRSTTVIQGEKSETNGLANGDFEVVFAKWSFNNIPQNPLVPFVALSYEYLRFNGNLTRINPDIGTHHTAEGSGNLYWQDKYKILPIIKP